MAAAGGALVIRRGKATIKVTGLSGILARLKRLGPDARAEGIRIIDAALGRAFAASQAGVPVDDVDGGQLKASGRKYNARTSKRSGRVTGSITYGGARLKRLAPNDNPIYAIVRHEDMTSPGAKFLEKPVGVEKRRLMGDLEQAIGRRIRSR